MARDWAATVAGKRFDPDGSALWKRVTETVRPLKDARIAPSERHGEEKPGQTPKPAVRGAGLPRSLGKGVAQLRPAPPGETLDGGWDRRLRRGVVAPDITIDLHGHTLASAHARLEAGLAAAILGGVRLILLVTGRPPREKGERIDGRPVRGAIRASVATWLHDSRHAGHVAAIRNAHPRHGGAGALYVVLRRPR